ncbi:hypothetical protein [Paraburkholderia phytofirmans]|jgi:hypothetical protein|uniref:hypothetical protein n=1 Tax=Paraburkholderia phytofirmans TaxID=261302 RepID=UPI0038B8D1F4
MDTPMSEWHEVVESETSAWARDLDPNLFSVDHRRLYVWQDELDGQWRWEIETFSGTGEAGSGIACGLAEAQLAADRAAAEASGSRG